MYVFFYHIKLTEKWYFLTLKSVWWTSLTTQKEMQCVDWKRCLSDMLLDNIKIRNFWKEMTMKHLMKIAAASLIGMSGVGAAASSVVARNMADADKSKNWFYGMNSPRSGARRKTLMYFIDYDEGTENERNDEIGRLCLNRHVGRCRFRDPSGAKYGCCPAISSVFGRVNGETAVWKKVRQKWKAWWNWLRPR